MQILIAPGARRDLDGLGADVARRVANAVQRLAKQPRPPGCLQLRNYEPPTWRLRVGDWRVLYEINDEAGIVIVTGVRHRSRAY